MIFGCITPFSKNQCTLFFRGIWRRRSSRTCACWQPHRAPLILKKLEMIEKLKIYIKKTQKCAFRAHFCIFSMWIFNFSIISKNYSSAAERRVRRAVWRELTSVSRWSIKCVSFCTRVDDLPLFSVVSAFLALRLTV